MDPLSDMLADIRSDGASVRRAALAAPWRLRFAGGAPLTMITAVAGEGVLVLADGTEHKLIPGTTAVIRGPEPFDLADGPDTLDRPIPAVAIEDVAIEAGPHAADASVVIAAAYRPARARHQRLLRALPAALVLDEDVEDVLWLRSMYYVLARLPTLGGQAMLDRILDWGLVCTLGCWFDQQAHAAPDWYRGALDPVTGPALEAIHQHPDRAWTVAELAARAHVSRAHFAKRFTEVMDRPPLRYLTERRMEIAADLLADPDVPVATAAAAVGYRDPFAFSTAFRRHQGMSPRAWRSMR